jgi:hypothetical protein
MAAENIEIREEDDGSVVVHDPAEQQPPQQQVEPPQNQDGGNDEDDDNDEQPSAQEQQEQAQEEANASNDAEREEIRRRRREERKQKKEHQKQVVSELRAELEAERRQRMEMAQRLAAVEQRNTGADIAAVDAAIAQANNAEQQLRAVLADAIAKQDGQTAAQATDRLLNVKREQDRLAGVKQTYQQRQSQPAPIDPDMRGQAEAWMRRTEWFRPNGADFDSRVVQLIDQEVARDGFDPRTPTYWAELDRRIAQRLPHRVKPQAPPQNTQRDKPARSPVAGSGRDSATARSGSTYVLAPERVQALKDAGMWDDPQVRADAIRRFREYDKKSAQGARN